ncbi:MAG: hypothetical protein AB7U34_05880 [Novosphingobium sp.]
MNGPGRKSPPDAQTTEGQRNAVGAIASAHYAPAAPDGKSNAYRAGGPIKVTAAGHVILPRALAELLATVLIDGMDACDGDADLEDGNDREASAGDDADAAWIEWHNLRSYQKGGHCIAAGHEDSEDDDPAGVHDEDGQNTGFAVGRYSGPGCPIADPGGCEHDGREQEDGR